MKKLAILKKVGEVALRVTRSQLGGGDRLGRLEAEKEMLELKVAILTDSLRDTQQQLVAGNTAGALDEVNGTLEILEATK